MMSARVKAILMERDGMDEGAAEDLIADFVEDLDAVLLVYADGSEEDAIQGLSDADELLRDYFGLEPDYLVDFL
jgi:predicted metallopeptidase